MQHKNNQTEPQDDTPQPSILHKVWNVFCVSDKGYDLPLNKSDDLKLLRILITLMSLLCVLTLNSSLVLQDITNRWSSGLENKITIEISPETKDGHILSADTIEKESSKIKETLQKNRNVKTANILKHTDIQELIAPWIGNDLSLSDIPLPGLIAVELSDYSENILINIKRDVLETSDYAHVETHSEWLNDLITLAYTLKTLALIVSAIIISLTVTSIITGMKTRMAIHKKEIELLHSMGAHDVYIAKQFQRHATQIAAQATLVGAISAFVILIIIGTVAGQTGSALLPNFSIGTNGLLTTLCIPLILTALCSLSARGTVLKSLREIP